MQKTPDKIKKGLADPIPVHYHPGDREPHLTPLAIVDLEGLHADALALIQQLEAQNAELFENIKWMEAERDDLKRTIHQLEAERDAAVADLKELASKHGSCFGCKSYTGAHCSDPEYKIICSFHADKWQWRGVQKEE